MRGVVQGLVSALLFGAATPASKVLLDGIPPVVLAGLLYLGAALAMAPVVVRRPKGAAWARVSGRSAASLAGAVALGGVLGPVLLLEGLRRATAGSVALLLNLEMAFTAALGAWWFREPLGRRGAFGAAGVVAAGALVSASEGWPGLGAGLLVAAACACWAVDNHLTARIDGVTPAGSTFAKGAVAGATNLTVGVAASGWPAAGTEVLAAALALGAASYGVSLALYIASAQQLGATRAQALFAVAPFLGAGLSWAALGERPAPQQLAAALALVASVLVLLRARHDHLHTHESLEHVHAHRHDDGHHVHAHPGLAPGAVHAHWHRHEPLVHAHPHWPDLHHRHPHRPD